MARRWTERASCSRVAKHFSPLDVDLRIYISPDASLSSSLSSCRLAHISPSLICSWNRCRSPAIDRVHTTTLETPTPIVQSIIMSDSETSFATTTGGISSVRSPCDSDVLFPTHPVHSKSSSADPSFALAAFKETKPLNGPPGEWIQAGISRSYHAEDSDMKSKMDAWDREWAKLRQKK